MCTQSQNQCVITKSIFEPHLRKSDLTTEGRQNSTELFELQLYKNLKNTFVHLNDFGVLS